MEKEPKIESSKDKSIEELIENLKEKKQECEDCTRFEILENIPPKMRNKVEERINMLEKAGVGDEDVLLKATEFFAKEVKTSYMDSRFETPNGTYLRMELVNRVDQMMEDEDVEEKLDTLGIISFDVNGLKAVNDINSHEAGDEYLEKIVDVLDDGEVTKTLENNGVDTFLAANGGDEFAVVLDSKFDLTSGNRALIGEIVEKYQREIKEIDCSDIIDFNDDEVRSKFKDLKLDIPESFEFMATISGGSCTLKEALVEVEGLEGDYHKILNNLMGELLDISDKRSIKNKEKIKKDLKEGSKEEKFLHKVLQRNEENIKAQKRIKELEKQVDKLKKQLESN